jgi:hypothetical protein
MTGLRVQDCVLLTGARGFAAQTNDNKVIRKAYVACRRRRRAAVDHRGLGAVRSALGQPVVPVPAFRSEFSDCPPGAMVRECGGVWFYDGPDDEAELRRIDGTAWRGRGDR